MSTEHPMTKWKLIPQQPIAPVQKRAILNLLKINFHIFFKFVCNQIGLTASIT